MPTITSGGILNSNEPPKRPTSFSELIKLGEMKLLQAATTVQTSDIPHPRRDSASSDISLVSTQSNETDCSNSGSILTPSSFLKGTSISSRAPAIHLESRESPVH